MPRPRTTATSTRSTTRQPASKRLGIGIVGSGFNAQFHLRSFVGVRDADIRGIWSPAANHAGRSRGPRPPPRCRTRQAIPVDRRHGRGPRHRRHLALRAQLLPPGECRGDHRHDRPRPRAARGDRLREAPRPYGRGGHPRHRTRQTLRPESRVPREPGVRPTGRARTAPPLGPRRRAHRPPLSRACRRGAQRAAPAMVLAGAASGRWGTE